MKVLLINPPFNISKNNYDTSMSVGVLSLATYLDSKGVEVKIIDAIRQRNFMTLIQQELANTDVVGLSVMTMQVGAALKISAMVKQYSSDIKIIWGGAHPTLFPEQVASHPLIDVAVINEGEETLLEVISNLIQRRGLSEVRGIAYANGAQAKVNQPRPFMNMDDLPLPKWDLLDAEVLKNVSLIPTHTSRGCPHQCAFCINSITNNRWRGYSADKVLQGLHAINRVEFFRDKPMRFWDENFFTDMKRVRGIIEGMIDQNLVRPWETTVRVDYVREGFLTDEFLSLLAKSGCYLFSYGGESGSEFMLKKINKGINPDQIIESAKETLKHDIIPQYSFMVGLPGESRVDIFKTINIIDRLVKLSPNIQILGPQAFRPYPGSALYHECVASGWQAPRTLNEWGQVSEGELNYMSVSQFPWLAEKNLVESLEAYVRFGAHTIKNAMGSSIKAAKWLKLPFVLLCQLRWKLKFFKWPLDYKLAKKFVTKV